MLTIEQILQNLHIEQLNPMQEAALDAGREQKDLILLSPTGSGKTLAYLLPLLEHLKEGIQGVQAVVLVPSVSWPYRQNRYSTSMGTPSE